MGYDQVVNHRGRVVSQRDLSREKDHYSTQWQVTQWTPEDVQAYLLQKYGKLPEPTKRAAIRVPAPDALSKDRYLKYREQGLNNAQIGAKFGITAQAIAKKAKAWGVGVGRGRKKNPDPQPRKDPEKILSKQQFCAEKHAGLSHPQIAKKYGLSVRTISRLAKKWDMAGELNMPEKLSAEQRLPKETFIAEKQAGVSHAKLAKKYGLSKASIDRLVRRWGLAGDRK